MDVISLDVMQRSLRVTTLPGKRISRETVSNAFRIQYGIQSVEAIWKMEEANTIYITKKDVTDAEQLARAGRVMYLDLPLFFHPCDRSRLTIRVHWLPFWLEPEPIGDFLSSYGTLESLTQEKDGGGVFTGVWEAVLVVREGDQNKLPYKHSFAGRTGLITFPGRAPMCFRCGQTGHIRAECTPTMRRRWEAPPPPRPRPQKPRTVATPSQEDPDVTTVNETPATVSQDAPQAQEEETREKRRCSSEDDPPTEKRSRGEEDTDSGPLFEDMDDIAPSNQSLTAMLDVASPGPVCEEPSRADRG